MYLLYMLLSGHKDRCKHVSIFPLDKKVAEEGPAPWPPHPFPGSVLSLKAFNWFRLAMAVQLIVVMKIIVWLTEWFDS